MRFIFLNEEYSLHDLSRLRRQTYHLVAPNPCHAASCPAPFGSPFHILLEHDDDARCCSVLGDWWLCYAMLCYAMLCYAWLVAKFIDDDDGA